ncbi:NACHT and WD repeat domain-containing protein [Streptomyces sp. NPDC088719]|uniref:NACHT and WD repeat domain-containing protein n=1 Tax=Streptomyces sp. NPDC088719 TaxID=3365872 RepID=UPI0038235CCE
MTENSTGASPSGRPPRWQPRRLEASVTDGGSVYQAGRDLFIRHGDEGRRTVPGPGADRVQCPYPGLAPFSAEHRQWFHGRERMVHLVCERMDARMREGGPLVLIGPSGAGKSSLLAAGVLPALDEGRLPVAGSSTWPRLLLTPTASPALAVAAAVGLDDETARRTVPTWRADPAQCVAELCEITGAGATASTDRTRSTGLIVVVDQFEEIFTACGDETEREWLIDVLDRLAQPEGGAVVVLGVRADFYAACTAHPQLRAALRAGPVLLEPMTQAELKDAIRRPAADVGLDVEDGLVEVLLADLGAVGGPVGTGTTGRLPLLAHALRATWQQRHGHTLTVDGYRVTGGIQGAIATTANRLYDTLPPPCHEAARWVFLSLVIVGRDADDSRRRVRNDELLRNAPDPEAAARVLDDFTRGRLLTRDQDTVVMTHEVLLRAWPRLRDWIEHDRNGNLVRQEVEEAAATWEQAGREAAALYRGNRLAAALAWSEARATDLSSSARAFLAAAHRHQRRGQHVRRAAVATITALAVIASLAAVFAFRQESQARDATAEALSERDRAITAAVTSASVQLAPTDPSLSAQLALTAYRMKPTEDAASRLITTGNTPLATRLPGPPGAVYTVAYSPDGHMVAAGNVHQNLVRLWDVSDPGRPVPLGRPVPVDRSVTSVLSVAFSPDGRVLAIGGRTSDRGDGTSGGFTELWSLTSPSHPVLLGRLKSPGVRGLDAVTAVESLAFSPDGRTLAAGWHAGLVSLWDVTRPDAARPAAEPVNLHCPGAFSRRVAFSPAGHTLAAACDDKAGTIGLWDLSDPARTDRGRTVKAGSLVNALAFSPDGRTLAAGASDSAVHLWEGVDTDRPTRLGKPLKGPAKPFMSVAFSPDGSTLAAGSADHSIYLWNVTHPKTIGLLGRPLTGPGSAVTDVVFSPDSRTLAAGNTDGNVDLWSLPPTRIPGAGGNVSSVAFSPDGRTLAAANQNATVSLWNTADPNNPVPRGEPLKGRKNPVNAVAFSPDGRTLAAGDSGGDVTLWNMTDPGTPVRLSDPLTGANGLILALAFSPDGNTLAAAGDDEDGRITLWDVSDPAHPVSASGISGSGGKSVLSLAFSPDGSILAAGGDGSNGTVGLWSTEQTGARVGKKIDQPTATSTWVAFSPNGRTLATGNSRGVVTLWDSTDPHHLKRRGSPLFVPGGSLWGVEFSPDGKTLVAGGHTDNGTIHLWDVADPNRPTAIGRPLTVETGFVAVLAFSPDSRTLAATTDDGVATLWDLEVESSISRICAASSGALGKEEWKRYVVQPPYDPPCTTS